MNVIPWVWRRGDSRAKGVYAAIILVLFFGGVAIVFGAYFQGGERVAIPFAGLAISALLVAVLRRQWENGFDSKNSGSEGLSVSRLVGDACAFYSVAQKSKILIVLTFFLLVLMMLSSPFILHFGSPFEVTDRRAAVLWVITVLLPVVAIWPVFALARVLMRWARVGGVGLSSEGLYVYAWTATSFFPWESIYGARAIDHGGPGIWLDIRERIPRADTPKPEEDWLGKWWMFRQGMRRRQLAQLGVHPALAFYAICFYLKHPEHRAELGTERAVERIRGLDMPDVIAEVEEHGDVRPEFWTAPDGSTGSE